MIKKITNEKEKMDNQTNLLIKYNLKISHIMKLFINLYQDDENATDNVLKLHKIFDKDLF